MFGCENADPRNTHVFAFKRFGDHCRLLAALLVRSAPDEREEGRREAEQHESCRAPSSNRDSNKGQWGKIQTILSPSPKGGPERIKTMFSPFDALARFHWGKLFGVQLFLSSTANTHFYYLSISACVLIYCF